MIYFDNSATTLMKPPQVAEAVAYAVNHFGNAGRSFYDAALYASREIFQTRLELAGLVGLGEPLNVAFTSSSTESLNLVIDGLIKKGDSVITTVTEHNSVLRPLYRKGCGLSFIGCGDDGVLALEDMDARITPSTRFLVCTHGSNVTGNVTDVKTLYGICRAKGITMILDVSQTLGVIPVHIGMADILCFTGHKGLFGPQGTGGMMVNGRFDFDIVKTGGAGVNSFDRFQSKDMPDVFEVGTLNSHGIYGLQKGVQFIIKTGIDEIHSREMQLFRLFYDGIKSLVRLRLYGEFSAENRLPVLSFNLDGLSSSELAELLWTRYGIASRPGSHCSPLLHKRFGTGANGMVRFSFSYFNTEEEILAGISALKEIAASLEQA